MKLRVSLHPAHNDHKTGKRCESPPDQWRVLDRHCNYSAFNGYHYTPSNYSACKCMNCGWVWRTKADYVALIADATPAERLK